MGKFPLLETICCRIFTFKLNGIKHKIQTETSDCNNFPLSRFYIADATDIVDENHLWINERKKNTIVYSKNNNILLRAPLPRRTSATSYFIDSHQIGIRFARRRHKQNVTPQLHRVLFTFTANVNLLKCVTAIYFVCLRSPLPLNLGSNLAPKLWYV